RRSARPFPGAGHRGLARPLDARLATPPGRRRRRRTALPGAWPPAMRAARGRRGRPGSRAACIAWRPEARVAGTRAGSRATEGPPRAADRTIALTGWFAL